MQLTGHEFASGIPPSGRRIALYSHDTMGVGHFRRNLLIAQTLCRASESTTALIIAGAREAGLFPLEPRIDCLTLPQIRKTPDGSYESGSLGISFERLIDIRGRTIRSALEAFMPDVLIVDKVPRGVAGELDSSLRRLKSLGRTSCVLGLRDILDDPEIVQREWMDADNEETVGLFYDSIWIYGDRAVYDTMSCCGFSAEVLDKTVYTGYLDPRIRSERAAAVGGGRRNSPDPPDQPYVLSLVGGGQDGEQLVDAVSRARLPSGMTAVILPGPFLPDDVRTRLQQRASQNSCLQVHEFVTDPERFIAGAERVITMGGYNSICEVLAFGKSALVVPRVQPRREQLVRAERLRDMGLVDLLRPEEITPQAISDWLAMNQTELPQAGHQIDMAGLLRLPQLLADLPAPAERSGDPAAAIAEGHQFVSR